MSYYRRYRVIMAWSVYFQKNSFC